MILGSADGQRADRRRRRQIALEQRGRDAEHVSVVVEAVGRIVWWQQRRPDRRRGPADREPRWRTRRDSAGAVTGGRDRDGSPPPDPGVVSRNDTSASCAAASGRGIPAGGMAPARSFRMTFSHISPFSATRAKSTWSRTTPVAVAAVRVRSLWQPAQYCVIVRARSAVAGGVSGGACARGAEDDTAAAHTMTARTTATRPPRMTRMSMARIRDRQKVVLYPNLGGLHQRPTTKYQQRGTKDQNLPECAAMPPAFRLGLAALLVALQVLASSAQGTAVRLVDVAADAGLDLVNVSGGPSKDFIVDANGNGAAFFDYDNDRDLDALIVNGSTRERIAAGGDPMVALYRNDGNGRFTDVTASSGFDAPRVGIGRRASATTTTTAPRTSTSPRSARTCCGATPARVRSSTSPAAPASTTRAGARAAPSPTTTATAISISMSRTT